LAGEANSPGIFSRKTVNLLSDLDKRDAQLFTHLCGFVWAIGTLTPLIYEYQTEIYTRQGIHFVSLTHLDNLGLINFQGVSSLARTNLPKIFGVSFYQKPLELTFPNDSGNGLDVGHAALTQAGMELAPVCGSSPVDGFFDFVYERWAARGHVPKKIPGEDTPIA
jgi:hypothetical protein